MALITDENLYLYENDVVTVETEDGQSYTAQIKLIDGEFEIRTFFDHQVKVTPRAGASWPWEIDGVPCKLTG